MNRSPPVRVYTEGLRSPAVAIARPTKSPPHHSRWPKLFYLPLAAFLAHHFPAFHVASGDRRAEDLARRLRSLARNRLERRFRALTTLSDPPRRGPLRHNGVDRLHEDLVMLRWWVRRSTLDTPRVTSASAVASCLLTSHTPMAFDTALVGRVRTLTQRVRGIAERRMFGGHCFLLAGHFCVAVDRADLIVRVPPSTHSRFLRHPHVRPFDRAGRPMVGWLIVAGAGLAGRALTTWVSRSLAFVGSLPAKAAAVGSPGRAAGRTSRMSGRSISGPRARRRRRPVAR